MPNARYEHNIKGLQGAGGPGNEAISYISQVISELNRVLCLLFTEISEFCTYQADVVLQRTQFVQKCMLYNVVLLVFCF